METSVVETDISARRRGYIQIYTGNGKGKTTAAIGLAVRAAGAGLKTYFGQFLKGQKYGELKTLSRLSEHITVEQFGKNTFVHVDKASHHDIQLAKVGLAQCREAMLSGRFDLIVMDEVCIAIHLGVLTVAEVMAVIDEKPENVELILTGRYAPSALVDKADLVTEMVEIKHYYQNGITARVGIER